MVQVKNIDQELAELNKRVDEALEDSPGPRHVVSGSIRHVRQVQIKTALALGMSPKQVAEEYDVSLPTVYKYRNLLDAA